MQICSSNIFRSMFGYPQTPCTTTHIIVRCMFPTSSIGSKSPWIHSVAILDTYLERERRRLSWRLRLGLGDPELELEERELEDPERLEPEEELEPLEDPELEPELLLELELERAGGENR